MNVFFKKHTEWMTTFEKEVKSFIVSVQSQKGQQVSVSFYLFKNSLDYLHWFNWFAKVTNE